MCIFLGVYCNDKRILSPNQVALYSSKMYLWIMKCTRWKIGPLRYEFLFDVYYFPWNMREVSLGFVFFMCDGNLFSWAPFYWYGFIYIPAWISNHNLSLCQIIARTFVAPLSEDEISWKLNISLNRVLLLCNSASVSCSFSEPQKSAEETRDAFRSSRMEVTGGFPIRMARNADDIFVSWRQHVHNVFLIYRQVGSSYSSSGILPIVFVRDCVNQG